MTLPRLGHNAIDRYNRLSKECAAFNYVLRHTRQTAPVTGDTIRTLNDMIDLANRLFCRHADLPRFKLLISREPMTQADLAIIVSRLTAACIHFEEHYTSSDKRDIARHYVAIEKGSYTR